MLRSVIAFFIVILSVSCDRHLVKSDYNSTDNGSWNKDSIMEFSFSELDSLQEYNMFINVNKKYDWDNLSEEDIVTLIEEKIQKEIDKVIHNWEDEGVRVEKARWGRHNIIKGKQKVELAKTVDVTKMTLEKALGILEKNAPKKKATKKKATKKTTAKKKATTKKK